MIFLNEKLIALLFSVSCMAVSLITGLVHHLDMCVLMCRALIFGVIGFYAGLLFGGLIRDLFLETINYYHEKEKEKQHAEAAQAAAQAMAEAKASQNKKESK